MWLVGYCWGTEAFIGGFLLMVGFVSFLFLLGLARLFVIFFGFDLVDRLGVPRRDASECEVVITIYST